MTSPPDASPSPDTLTAEERREALDVARRLAELGIPIFVAPPAKGSSTGFALPNGWQNTAPDPTVVDTWKPGSALCAVMGAGVDLLDVDTRNGGEESLAQLNGSMPRTYGVAATPSGGWHYLIASLRIGSRDGVYPGLDVKGGRPDGQSRGFAFLAPTERASKVDGQPHPYRWHQPPDAESLTALLRGDAPDASGAELANKIVALMTKVRRGRRREQGSGRLWEWANQRAPHSWKVADKVIERKLAAIASWDAASGSGGRQTIMDAAFTLGGYVASEHHFDEAQARERLAEACAARWGSADEDDLRWIDQGVTEGQWEPLCVYTPEQEAHWREGMLTQLAALNAWRQGQGLPHIAADDYLRDQGDDDDEALAGLAGFIPVALAQGLNGSTLGIGIDAGGSGGAGSGGEGPAGLTGTLDDDPPLDLNRYLGPHFDPNEDSTDQGFAQETVLRMHPVLRFATDTGGWVQRKSLLWVERKKSAAMERWAVKEVADRMPLGESPLPSNKADYTEAHWQAHRRGFFRSSAGTGRIAAKLKDVVVGGNHPCALEVSRLDTEPEILWAGGVPWDLRASLDRPVASGLDPNTPHLHSAWCSPAAGETPAWDAFMEVVFPDPDVRAWALRVLSIGLTGHPDAAMPILHGPARSGKSSVLKLLVGLLGTYGISANPKLLSPSDNSHDAIIYQLKGARLAFIDEGPKPGAIAAERLKQLTGGAQLTASQKGADPIVFEPTHTLAMTANEPPPMTDLALVARYRLIPCDVPEEAVKPVRERLADPVVWRAEAPAILAMMITECARWLADRSSASVGSAPSVLLAEAADLEAAQNPVSEWVRDCTVPTEPGSPSRDLHRAYLAWHQQQHFLERVPPVSETSFGRKLTKLGFPPVKRRDGEQTLWYRSLSVLGGGGYGPPLPTVRVLTGQEDVPDTTRNTPNPEHQPGTSQSPRSSPVLDTSVPDVPGLGSKVEFNNTTTPYRGTEDITGNGIGGAPQNPEQTIMRTGPDLGCSGVPDRCSGSGYEAGTVTERSRPAPEGVDLPDATQEAPVGTQSVTSGALDLPIGLPEGFDPLAPITPAQKKLWAAAHGISESQASGQLKERKKQAKQRERQLGVQARICELSGPEHDLPVALNRALEIRAVEPEHVVGILRAVVERAGGQLTVDMENTGYPVGHRHYELRTVQLGDEELTLVLDPVEHAEQIRDLLDWAPMLVAHSGQADLVALAHARLGDFEAMMAKLRDTAVLARLADPKTCGSDGGLKEIAPKLLGERAVTARTEADRKALFGAGGWLTDTKIDTPVGRSGWAQVSRTGATMIRYAGADVLDTAAISRSLPWIPEWLTDRERIVQGMTARITYAGAPLDHEKIRELESAHTPERDRLAAEIRAFPGIAVENPGSPKQLAAAFAALGMVLPPTKPDRFGRGGGSPSTASAVLTVLRREHPDSAIGELAGLVLGYRHHETALGTFIGPYKALCELGDARVRPTIYTVGTDTGRTSCVRPNAQQLPRQGGFRAMYGADPGMVIVRADFSGVEIRGAAALSGDATLLESIRVSDELGSGAHADIHWLTAKQAFGPDATKEHRYLVKPGVFTHLYGGRAPTIAEQLGITLGEAELIARSLETLTPTYQAWSRSLIEECRRGRISFDSYSGRKIWISEPRKAPNYAVQGSCREILVDAMLRWRDTRWGGCMILPVHDELLAWVPAEDAHEATAALVECMTTSLTGPSGATVPIKAEPDDPDPETGRWTGSPFWPDAS